MASLLEALSDCFNSMTMLCTGVSSRLGCLSLRKKVKDPLDNPTSLHGTPPNQPHLDPYLLLRRSRRMHLPQGPTGDWRDPWEQAPAVMGPHKRSWGDDVAAGMEEAQKRLS